MIGLDFGKNPDGLIPAVAQDGHASDLRTLPQYAK